MSGRFLRRELRGRIASMLSVVDQAVASLTSFLVVVVAARLLGVEEFGAFSVVFVLYTILLGGIQAYIGQELVLTEGARGHLVERSWEACRAAFLIALPLGAVVLLSGVVLPELRSPLFALAIGLPVLLVHETVRFVMSLLRAIHVALTLDALRAVSLTLVLVAPLAYPGEGSFAWDAGSIFLAWIGATALSLVPLSGAVIRAAARRPGRSWSRMFRREYLGHRFFAEFVAVRASSQGLTIALGAMAGVAATGALRAISTLFGPVNVLFNAVVAFAVPILRDRPQQRLVRALIVLSGGLSSVALGLTALLLLLPQEWGEALLGATWNGARALILPVGVQAVGLAISTVMVVGIRMVDPASTLVIRLVGAAMTVAFFFVGFALADVLGAVWGLCAASWAQSAMLVARYARLRRRGEGALSDSAPT